MREPWELSEVLADSFQRLPQGTVCQIGEASHAQLLTAGDKLGEASRKVAKGFEHAPPQVGHEGRTELQGQGRGPLPHGALNLEPRLEPLLFRLALVAVLPR